MLKPGEKPQLRTVAFSVEEVMACAEAAAELEVRIAHNMLARICPRTTHQRVWVNMAMLIQGNTCTCPNTFVM